MEIAEKYRELIEKAVKNNTKYQGHEDLFDDFCSETFKRIYKILDSQSELTNVKAYIHKVASSAILDVLSKSGKLKKSKGKYEKLTTVPLHKGYELNENKDLIYNIEDPAPGIEDELIKKEFLSHFYSALVELDKAFPKKDYLSIYRLRFIELNKQDEIAKLLGISQGEVSKRLLEIARNILDHKNFRQA